MSSIVSAQTSYIIKITNVNGKLDTTYTDPPKGYVDVFPRFRGDENKYIQTHMRYPSDAKDKKIAGTVEIDFTVDEEGNLSDITVGRKLYPSLDAEAVRLVKAMPAWKPAMRSEKPVKASWYTDITFR